MIKNIKRTHKIILAICIISTCSLYGRKRHKPKSLLEAEHVEEVTTTPTIKPIPQQTIDNASVSISPIFKKITYENKEIARELQQAETAAQEQIQQATRVAEQLAQKGTKQRKQLVQQEATQASMLHQQYTQTMQQLQQNFDTKLKSLAQQREEKEKQLAEQIEQERMRIINKAEEDALRRINEVEMKLLEKHLAEKRKLTAARVAKEPQPLAAFAQLLSPSTTPPIQDVETWKIQKKAELIDNMSYLGPILEADTELGKLLENKKVMLDTKITNTQLIGDADYQTVMQELKPLTMMCHTQKIADVLLTDALTTMQDVSEEMRQKIRLLVLYELPPLIQSGEEISQKDISTLVKKAITQAEQKQLSLEETDETEIALSAEKQLRDQLAVLTKTLESLKTDKIQCEIALTREREEKKTFFKKSQQATATIQQLKQQLIELQKEKVNLEIKAEKTNRELAQIKKVNTERLSLLEQQLGTLKKEYQDLSKKHLDIKITLEQTKQNLALAKLSTQEKQKQNIDLEQNLEKANRDLLETQIKAKEVENLEQRVHLLQSLLTESKQAQTTAQNKQTELLEQVNQLKREAGLQKELFKIREETLHLERSQVQRDMIRQQELLAEMARIRRDIEQLTWRAEKTKEVSARTKIETTISEKEEALAARKKEVSALAEKKRAVESEQEALLGLQQQINQLTQQAQETFESAQKQKVESEIAAKQRQEKLNQRLKELMKQLKAQKEEVVQPEEEISTLEKIRKEEKEPISLKDIMKKDEPLQIQDILKEESEEKPVIEEEMFFPEEEDEW